MKTPKEWAAECRHRLAHRRFEESPVDVIEVIVTEALAERDAEIARYKSGFEAVAQKYADPLVQLGCIH